MIISASPAQLRRAANIFDAFGVYADEAAELRSIAGRLDRGETVTREQPAYTVTYQAPAGN